MHWVIFGILVYIKIHEWLWPSLVDGCKSRNGCCYGKSDRKIITQEELGNVKLYNNDLKTKIVLIKDVNKATVFDSDILNFDKKTLTRQSMLLNTNAREDAMFGGSLEKRTDQPGVVKQEGQNDEVKIDEEEKHDFETHADRQTLQTQREQQDGDKLIDQKKNVIGDA